MVVADGEELDVVGDELLLLERMVEALNRRAGSGGTPLFVPVADSSTWAKSHVQRPTRAL